MKFTRSKKLIACLLAALVLVSLSACTTGQYTPTTEVTTEVTTPPGTPAQLYRRLNDMAALSYRVLEVTVTTATNGATLTGTYRAEQKDGAVEITYTYEQLNPISADPDAPYKTVCSGSMVLRDGNIVQMDGDDCFVSLEQTANATFCFSEETLASPVISDGALTATVIDPSAFLGAETDFADARLSVTFSETALVQLTLSGATGNGAQTTAVYSFTR